MLSASARHLTTLIILVAAFCAGCSSRSANEPVEEAEPEAVRPPRGMGDEMLCPSDISGVEIATQDVEGGILLVFRGPADRVDEVRRLTEQMAGAYMRCQEMMDTRTRMPRRGARPSRMGQGPRGPMGPMMPETRVEVRQRGDGAEILMLAENVEEVEALRAQQRWHVEMMRLGHCPPMQIMWDMEHEMGAEE